MKNLSHYQKEIEKWHIEALVSFTLYQEILMSTAPNKVGLDVAKENLAVRKEYAGVFHPMQNSARIASFSNLAKIFIGYQDAKTGKISLSLEFLLQELEKAQNLPNFDKKYAAELKHNLRSNKKVKELRKLRNQQIAHIDLTPDLVSFSDKHFKDLLSISNRILMFSNWCINDNEQGENYYQKLANDIEWDFGKMLDALKLQQH